MSFCERKIALKISRRIRDRTVPGTVLGPFKGPHARASAPSNVYRLPTAMLGSTLGFLEWDEQMIPPQ